MLFISNLIKIDVLAEVDEEYANQYQRDVETDEIGHITHGTILVNHVDSGVQEIYTLNNDSGLYLIYNINNDIYSFNSCDGTYISYHHSIIWSDHIDDEDRTCGSGTAYWSINQSLLGGTNIPIFNEDDTDAINSYINDGDYSGAENYEDLFGGSFEYSENIELPQNLYCISGYKYPLIHDFLVYLTKDITINWKQTVDTTDYVYDMDVKFKEKLTYPDLGGNHHRYIESKWYSLHNATTYDGKKDLTLILYKEDLNKCAKDFENGTNFNSDNGDHGFNTIETMYLRVRNRSGKYISNYVTIAINFETGNVSLSETDEDGKTVENAQYDNDDGTIDQEDDSSSNSSNSYNGNFGSLSSIMQYIRDGFGLIGNGGILTLMSATFLYLPNSIWIILKFFVSMMVAIALVKLVKDVIL